VRAPAIPYLGVRPDVVAIGMGYGHRASATLPAFNPKSTNPVQWGYGRYARDLGVNALDLLPAGTTALTTAKVTISRTGDHIVVPSTEGSARQHGRGIAQAITADEQTRGLRREEEARPVGDASHAFLPGLRSPVAADAQGELGAPADPDQGKNKGLYSPNDPRHMAARRWAMAIDLARCTGCSACVTACYAENNIPTVGAPWQNATLFAPATPGFNIGRGREMQWMRIERYFEGADDGRFGEEFETRFVPMLCQHCGNAPCEPVCPVYATYHAPDGLNVQVYNRCVGTRYCSNNCPYKVRYFNWFGYGEPDRKQYAFPEPLNWQLNPDVTVRGKGVMEKCSMCVQRIREAENRAALEHRELTPDEFTTSCAAACPSRAITFGDAADPQWTVAKRVQDQRGYHVFEELNTYTAVVYLKKVNHPAPAGGTTAAPATPR
jgi:molybdopterin-containing oxidoreductase family iron-sulfur binding subunit